MSAGVKLSHGRFAECTDPRVHHEGLSRSAYDVPVLMSSDTWNGQYTDALKTVSERITKHLTLVDGRLSRQNSPHPGQSSDPVWYRLLDPPSGNMFDDNMSGLEVLLHPLGDFDIDWGAAI